MKLLSLILCIVLIWAEDKLLNVQGIWRHGARNYYYCNWNCDESQARGDGALLTPTGMRQQYVLGKWIRQRYIIDNKFLSETFNENEIYIESSDVNRTLQSAYSQLQGMYPEGPEVPKVSNDKLLPPNQGSVTPDGIGNNALPNKIQLIPIHTKDKSTDYAIALSCPTSKNMTDANKKTALYKEVNDKAAQLFKDFNTQLGLTGDKEVHDFIELSNWRDTFICNRYNGDLLPPNLKSETLKQIDDAANLAFSLEKFQTWEQTKIYTTPYFKSVIDNFDSYLNGSSHFKYRGSSGHDSTLLAILQGLNLTSAQCQANRYLNKNDTIVNCITQYVEFASNIFFELFNNSITGPYVKVLYNGEYMPICSDYGKTCKYSTFRSIMMAQQVDHKKMCNIPDNSEIPIEEKSPGWAIAFFVIVTVLAVGGGAVIFIIQSKLRSKTLIEE